jgi:hypothetical protein
MGVVQSIATRRNLQPSVSAFGPRTRIERRQLKILPGMRDHPTTVMVRASLLAILTVDHIDYLIRRYAIGYWLRIPLR